LVFGYELTYFQVCFVSGRVKTFKLLFILKQNITTSKIILDYRNNGCIFSSVFIHRNVHFIKKVGNVIGLLSNSTSAKAMVDTVGYLVVYS